MSLPNQETFWLLPICSRKFFLKNLWRIKIDKEISCCFFDKYKRTSKLLGAMDHKAQVKIFVSINNEMFSRAWRLHKTEFSLVVTRTNEFFLIIIRLNVIKLENIENHLSRILTLDTPRKGTPSTVDVFQILKELFLFLLNMRHVAFPFLRRLNL